MGKAEGRCNCLCSNLVFLGFGEVAALLMQACFASLGIS